MQREITNFYLCTSVPPIYRVRWYMNTCTCSIRIVRDELTTCVTGSISPIIVFIFCNIEHVKILVVVVVVVLLLTTKSHTNRSHVLNIFTCVVIYSINIFVFCKKHDFLLQKGTMKLTTARLNYLHLTSSTEIHSIVRSNQYTMDGFRQ